MGWEIVCPSNIICYNQSIYCIINVRPFGELFVASKCFVIGPIIHCWAYTLGTIHN